MGKTIDPEDYKYIPGVSEVVWDADIDELGLHDLDGNPIAEESLGRESEKWESRTRAGLIPGGKSLTGGSGTSPRPTGRRRTDGRLTPLQISLNASAPEKPKRLKSSTLSRKPQGSTTTRRGRTRGRRDHPRLGGEHS
jgi:hypothetical protein